jgi:hypothetical protein
MTKRMPPVPPANRSPKGPGDASTPEPQPRQPEHGNRERNLAEQGRQGNIAQNTTHQGYQQDR